MVTRWGKGLEISQARSDQRNRSVGPGRGILNSGDFIILWASRAKLPGAL